MTITRSDLVAAFPEFGDVQTYPDAQVTFWLGEAANQISEANFGKSYTLATLLFVAHNIALSALAQRAGTAAGSISLAPVTSKSVGGVSKSMDVNLTAYAGAGPWNATAYGQRFYGLLRQFAVGPAYSVRQATSYGTPGGYGLGAYGYRPFRS